MNFTIDYFDDEVRDGFFIPGLMKREWAAELEVLSEVDKVCQKHNIKWFAFYGTLIGAVRHGGFIPWDDDVDICMLREDYDRFVDIALDEMPEGYHILSRTLTKDFDNAVARVVNSNEIGFDSERMEKYHDFPYSAGVDIFILDNIAPNEETETLRKNLIKKIIFLLDEMNDDNQNLPEFQQNIAQVEQLCDIQLDRTSSIKKQFYALIDKMFYLYKTTDSKEVAIMPDWVMYNNQRFKCEYFKDIVRIPFENTYIQIPAMYDEILKMVYGNYMHISQNGGVHDYPCYSVQERVVVKGTDDGRLPYRYYYSFGDISYVKNDNDNIRKRIQTQIIQMVKGIQNLHKEVRWQLICDNLVEVTEMLVQCQNSAVNVGNIIEQIYGQNHVTVRSLEEYCEEIFVMHQFITSDEYIYHEHICDGIDMTLSKVICSVDKDICRQKEVVFIPYKASQWKSLEGLWRKHIEDKECMVYVIPIPYYYKSPSGKVSEEYYEGECFPQYVRITHYEEYNFQIRQPDIIYFQCPYDQYNPVISVHPFAYAANMRKFTEELIFVQPFIIDEIEEGHEKALHNISEYFCSIGIMLADKVIVQSENMKNILVEQLTKFAENTDRKLWENKLIGMTLYNMSELKAARRQQLFSEFSDKWKNYIFKDDGSMKKVVLYYNSISILIQYKEKAILKIKSVLDTFKENDKNILLVWKHNPIIQSVIENRYPKLWKEYNSIIKQYKSEGFGIYEENEKVEDIVDICDAYYGDSDSIVQKCRRAGIPIMIENVEIT